MTLGVSYTNSFEGVDTHEWRRLAERAGNIFATPEWLLTWWRLYGKPGRALIGVARDDGDAVAIVPLYEWWVHGLSVLRFIGHGPSDQLGPICAPPSEPTVAAAVTKAIDAIPLRRYALVAEDVGGEQRFGELTGARTLYREASPVLRLERVAWDDFLQKLRPDLRQQVRRYPRRVSELGNVSYRLASDPDRLQQDLDTLFALHRLRWGSDATSFVRAAPFHREFAGEALDQGWLRLWFLELNGRPVAAQYGFQFAGAECVYQSGRDLSFRRQSIGFVLLVHAIRQALADGMGEYRFLRGVTEIKERFSTGDPGLETYGLPRGVTARALLAAVSAARGRSLGLRRVLARL